MTDARDAVAHYGERFHRAVGAEHHVASPLGAWIVLALAAPATDDERLRSELADVLAMPVEDAARAARRLLIESPPDIVVLAAAAWARTDSAALRDWLATLPDEVETGPVPSQEQVNAWAGEHTLGLIKQFPLEMTAIALVLCTAIACQISWAQPFDPIPVNELRLPAAPDFDVATLLHSPRDGVDHRTWIVATDAGLMAVHAAMATDQDMAVVSVSADPSVPADVVMRHAHVIAGGFARRSFDQRMSLFDLPLGTGHSWTLEERTEPGTRDREVVDVILPAWSADSTYNLMALDVGFGAAGEALRRLVDGLPPVARQVAVAQYTREGFKAAAVTAIGIPMAFVQQRDAVRIREARVEFTHPHAVVAVSVVRDEASPWAGMPLFSAWVARADAA